MEFIIIYQTWEGMKHHLPSKRASDTSSLVTLSALNRIAMFCDFFGSNTLFSNSTGGSTDFLVTSFGTEFAELQPKRVSIMSSFNLQSNEANKYCITSMIKLN